MALPDFTASQRGRLAKLGVLPEQIEQLRYALIEVKRALRPPPGRNATKKILAAVTKHADALAGLLANMWNQTDTAHAAAMIEVEQRYWRVRPEDIGSSSAHNVIPRLVTLADAARDAVESMPLGQSRHLTGSGRPIGWIADALLEGWIAAQGPREVRIIDGMEFRAALPPYPAMFHAHESEAFMGVVAVCYEAAGAPQDYEPLAAIRTYVSGQKRLRNEAAAEIERALHATPRGSKPRLSARSRGGQ